MLAPIRSGEPISKNSCDEKIEKYYRFSQFSDANRYK